MNIYSATSQVHSGFPLWAIAGSSNLIRAFMLVVPGVLVIGPVVLLAVVPHANLHLLFLVPAIAHIHVLPTPCIHGLRTCSYKVKQRKTVNEWIWIHFMWNFKTQSLGCVTLYGSQIPLLPSLFACVGFFTHQTCAARPSHTQNRGYLDSVQPSWS